MAFTEMQPQAGDGVLHCGHCDDSANKPFHFYRIGGENGVPFTRPDGTTGRAKWIVRCARCHWLNPRDAMAGVSADSIWTGDTPIVEVDVQ